MNIYLDLLIELFGLLKKFWYYFAAFIGAFYTVFKLFQGRLGLLTLFLIFGISSFWIICFLIRFDYVKIPSPTFLVFSHLGLFIIPLAVIIGLVGWVCYQTLPSDKVIIVVANFDGPEPQNYRVSEIISGQLKDATRRYKGIQVKPISEIISFQQGSEVARKKAK